MELTNLSISLNDSIRETKAIGYKLEELAKEWALAEKDYQKAKTAQVMELKEKGLPVTLIAEIVRGMPHIADLKYQRDLSAEVLKANHKLLSVLGDSMSASQSLLKYQSEI